MASNRLITRLQLVERVNVSKSQLYRDCEKGGKLHAAMVSGKVDLNHKNAAMYCVEHDYQEPDVLQIKATAKKAATSAPQYLTESATDIIPPDAVYDDEDLGAAEYMDMPLREIVKRFGKQAQFKDLVSAYKTLVSTQAVEEKMARDRRDFCAFVHLERLAMHIDGLHKQLLGDTAKGIAEAVTHLVKAGATEIEIRKDVTKTISAGIRMSKVKSEALIREAKS